MARGRSTDHAGSRNKGRSRSQSKTRKLKCYHCHKERHYRKDCPKRKGKKKDNSKTADAGVIEDNSDGAYVLSVTISSSDGGWILDTEYMTEDSSNLEEHLELERCGLMMWIVNHVISDCSLTLVQTRQLIELLMAKYSPLLNARNYI
ncbi:hypothetical protein RJ640_007790 [Escallonia rubra]|uniref:CCHC-type domain-containing protein n=1 Tax=Escallonia rubra TaxID=112253 RepID=A0AA88S260_9ASTE|nr:hypothetical protein RJ640_007790 [Escallonia rubra]